MVIITYKIIKEYSKLNSSITEALNRWYTITSLSNWNNLTDIQNDFNTVDYVGNDRYIFNIGGNKYRLIAMIHFSTRTVYIRFIGTHKEYDKIDCKTI